MQCRSMKYIVTQKDRSKLITLLFITFFLAIFRRKLLRKENHQISMKTFLSVICQFWLHQLWNFQIMTCWLEGFLLTRRMQFWKPCREVSAQSAKKNYVITVFFPFFPKVFFWTRWNYFWKNQPKAFRKMKTSKVFEKKFFSPKISTRTRRNHFRKHQPKFISQSSNKILLVFYIFWNKLRKNVPQGT